MDDPRQLREEFLQLTTDYEKAVHATFISFASIGPNPSPPALAAWKSALEKEESIRLRRDVVLNKLLKIR
jgi:hypothetical protein